MGNKGFTLVELVVMIAVLALISIICFISVNDIVDQSEVDNCNNLVNNIKSATKEYVSDYRYKNTFDSDNNKIEQVSVQYLINNKYLTGPITNPFKKEELVDPNTILVNIELNDDYTAKEVNLYRNSLAAGNILECVEEKW